MSDYARPCPRCGEDVEDLDGFGVLAHVGPDGCGFCTCPSKSGGVCSICGSTDSPAPVDVGLELDELARRGCARRIAATAREELDERFALERPNALGPVHGEGSVFGILLDSIAAAVAAELVRSPAPEDPE